MSRDTLMTKLWESDSFVDENTLSVNVGRLRKKLDAAGLPDFILTKKGIGTSYQVGDVDEAENRGSYKMHRLKWIAAVIGCGDRDDGSLILNEVPAGEIAYGGMLCYV